MRSDFKTGTKAFCRLNRAYYAEKDRQPEIMVGIYHDEGNGDYSTSGEFSFTWQDFGDVKTIKLNAFNDSWCALNQFKDLIEGLEVFDDNVISDDDFADVLKHYGLKDITKYEPK